MDQSPEGYWPVIGIDLGTTNSCVGIWQHGGVEIITNDQGNRTTPSCVAFTDTGRLIGEAAINQRRTNSINTIFDAKRFIGRRFNDKMVQNDMKLWPFKVIAGPVIGKAKDRVAKVKVNITDKGREEQLSGEEISAMVLVKMKDTAEAYLGLALKSAVISVPAYFNYSQRQATIDAAAIAGLNVLRIINEPTAAAIAYGFQMPDNNESKKNVLVLDLGGGTFDVSLVSVEKNTFKVKAVGGDANIGGCDFDNRMVSRFVQEFKAKHKIDVSQCPKALGRLRAVCEKAKRELSLVTQTSVGLDSLSQGIDFSSTISRSDFENMNADLFNECIKLVKQCLSDAHIRKSDVDDIVLVGGSTRIPKVQQLLQELFDGKELCKSINPDEAVAYGVAAYAGFFHGKMNDKCIVLFDVTPSSITVRDNPYHNNMDFVIPKNINIPWETTHRYHIKIHKRDFLSYVYEGNTQKLLGVIELRGITQSTQCVDVRFKIDVDGILNISANEMNHNYVQNKIEAYNWSRLRKTEMERMIEKEENYKGQERKYEERLNAKNTLEDYVNDTREKLANGMDIIQEIHNWIDSNSNKVLDEVVYEEKLEEIKQITKSLSVENDF